MTINFLDRALLYIKTQASFTPTKSEVPEFTQQENRLLVRALYKLEKDGYVYTNTRVDEKGNKSVTFFISFDGLLALERSPIFWKNRPYRWGKNKELLTTIWRVAKIILIVLNSLAILYLMWLAIPK
jgi:hypothetical protein